MATVMTILGPVEDSTLGPTLPHEHIFVNLSHEYRGTGLLNDFQLMVSEVNRFVEIGGRTIVDVTPPELTHGASPDPNIAGVHPSADGTSCREVANLVALHRLAKETGINLVVATGHYRDPYLDRDWFGRKGVDAVAELLIEDVQVGIAGTDMRAGIIGEIGSDKWFISDVEERSFKAAARAQLATGLSITTHANRWPVGLLQIDLLVSVGVDPRRLIIGHCDSVPLPGYHEALARRHVFVQFDHCRGLAGYETRRTVETIMDLVRGGYLRQILLSSDVCLSPHLHTNGGNGFSYVGTGFREALLEAGLSEDEFYQLHVDNPRRALIGEW